MFVGLPDQSYGDPGLLASSTVCVFGSTAWMNLKGG